MEDMMKVCMGKAEFIANRLFRLGQMDDIVSEPIKFQDHLYNTACMGIENPQCLIMMEEVARETTNSNIQLWKVLDRKNIRVEHYAKDIACAVCSGTNACAGAIAAYRMGVVERNVTVHMPEGNLLVEIAEDDMIYMSERS